MLGPSPTGAGRDRAPLSSKRPCRSCAGSRPPGQLDLPDEGRLRAWRAIPFRDHLPRSLRLAVLDSSSLRLSVLRTSASSKVLRPSIGEEHELAAHVSGPAGFERLGRSLER